jgi:hypothetical protein
MLIKLQYYNFQHEEGYFDSVIDQEQVKKFVKE